MLVISVSMTNSRPERIPTNADPAHSTAAQPWRLHSASTRSPPTPPYQGLPVTPSPGRAGQRGVQRHIGGGSALGRRTTRGTGHRVGVCVHHLCIYPHLKTLTHTRASTLVHPTLTHPTLVRDNAHRGCRGALCKQPQLRTPGRAGLVHMGTSESRETPLSLP